MKKRLVWADNLKTLCCILVVIGHFSQSMVKSKILPENFFYSWLHTVLGFFLVPLFFVCSGYIYQTYSKVDSLRSWGKNILKKMLSLIIPYFIFSTMMWIFKNILSEQVNSQTSSILNNLFINPLSPYWYLYYSFFIFLITPTFSNKKMANIGLTIALVLRMFNVFDIHFSIPVVEYVLFYEFWFVLGMYLSINKFHLLFNNKNNFFIGIFLMCLFLFLSCLICINQFSLLKLYVPMGCIGCISFILIFGYIFKDNRQNKLIKLLVNYIFPIFLMHTFFASFVRIVLLNMGIKIPIVHILLGVFFGFIGPILTAKFFEKTKYLNFVLYPTRFIKETKKEIK